MKKTNFVLKFEFKGASDKVLEAKVKLPKPIFRQKFFKVNTFQPTAISFILTSPLVDESFFFSNSIYNRKNGIIGIGLSGSGSNHPMVPINPTFSPLREFSVFMFYPTKTDAITDGRRDWVRANLFIFHEEEEEREMLSKEMSEKKTFFFLKLDVDRSDTISSTVFELPKPIYGAKEIQVINWISGGGGFDYIMSPKLEGSLFFSNDEDVDMPVIAYGVNGVSRDHQRMKIQECFSTLNKIHLKMIKTNKAVFPMKFCLVYFAIFHK